MYTRLSGLQRGTINMEIRSRCISVNIGRCYLVFTRRILGLSDKIVKDGDLEQQGKYTRTNGLLSLNCGFLIAGGGGLIAKPGGASTVSKHRKAIVCLDVSQIQSTGIANFFLYTAVFVL
ncbi:hypothetical protein BJV82DRAFT_416661 [Fennellomyces sp. T-0311]|nr:hypothetical protein BJV82DRAFT_416661 [Fennellomyces sp. T-0311]